MPQMADAAQKLPSLTRLFSQYFQRSVEHTLKFRRHRYEFKLHKLADRHWKIVIVERHTLPAIRHDWRIVRRAEVQHWTPGGDGLHWYGRSFRVSHRRCWSRPEFALRALERAEALSLELGADWPLSFAVALQQMRAARPVPPRARRKASK